ncbi:PstS family phosphate ABC transporter substrate-binding protein [Vibrio sp. SM6]|uniref:PstS family phosphate ABC transporter substrate-binding protein n=1 Tax=Vibrio agarilyticus TaxID=2726741 RepID=A0A7X8TPU6_9VIBR|nr:PstS family phosphate ABC transporter substrate-binding protein [Vibrio agarilyticus]NLS12013.1 PstS family phosphate ABC transporter substrate-binding protein [Vibrio agarilyticus]
MWFNAKEWFSAAAILLGVFTAHVGDVAARDQISIVGSSTVYPFATVVAERFGKTSDYLVPKVESTGSGGGLKLFCAGVGEHTPDIANASRKIKSSEIKRCAQNGVTEIVEVKVGYDGIALANATQAEPLSISVRDLYRALAKVLPDGKGGFVDNPYTHWNQIDPSLPNSAIEVLGPPPTSGTRDAFVELVMEAGCKLNPAINALKKSDKAQFKAVCHGIREDGAFVEAGENDNLIVQKLTANPNAFGIFGFSFLDQNRDKVQGATINGVAPSFAAIGDGRYPVSRSLFFYVKKAHLGVIPGIEKYVAEFTSENAIGDDGYLADRGLIPLAPTEWQVVRNDATTMTSNL